ncbi:MAG: YraN family protein [Candidatus Komeilibacteria bacterium]|nr:YraN family protein [Candidatus Komeilibacteria bacterium]
MNQRQKLGKLGEKLTLDYLWRQGFSVWGKNIYNAYGEIDILVSREGILHFVEVKTLSTMGMMTPQANFTVYKQRRLYLTVLAFIEENNIGYDWQIDFCGISVDNKSRCAKLSYTQNVPLDERVIEEL